MTTDAALPGLIVRLSTPDGNPTLDAPLQANLQPNLVQASNPVANYLLLAGGIAVTAGAAAASTTLAAWL